MWTIRIAGPADAREVAGIYGPIVAHTAISFETEIPTEMEFERRISSTLAFLPWLVCADGERVAA